MRRLILCIMNPDADPRVLFQATTPGAWIGVYTLYILLILSMPGLDGKALAEGIVKLMGAAVVATAPVAIAAGAVCLTVITVLVVFFVLMLVSVVIAMWGREHD